MDNLHPSVSDLGNGNESHQKEEYTVNELGYVLHDTLQVKDGNLGIGSDLPSEDDGEDEIISDDCDINSDGSMETSNKCLQKCATSPVTMGTEKTPDLQSENNSYTHRKLVSAMKGSREKEGAPPRKLSVSWAPDVYDPPPTSLSPHPKKKNQQQFKSNKKYGKGKQKGKNMRGGGSNPKDKKHYRKIGGKSDWCLDSYADTDRVMSSNGYKSSVEVLDFEVDDEDDDVCGHESYCGVWR